MVDDVISFSDTDDTANHAIFQVQSTHSGRVIFANGGDRTHENIPEMRFTNVEFVFNVGGEKTISSTNLLNAWTK